MRTVIFLLLLAGQAFSADLTLMVGENPPFNSIKDGKPEGMAVDIVNEMLRRAQLEANHPQYSWSRAFNLAQSEKNHCVYLLARIPERETNFVWIGPITYNKWAFFGLKKRKLNLSTLDDARPYSIAGQLRDAKATWLAARGFKIDYSLTEKQSLQKLLSGRVDLYPGGLLSIKELSRLNNFDASEIEPLLIFNKAENFIGCSHSTDEVLIEKLRAALDSMTKDNKTSEIWKIHETKFGTAGVISIE